MARRGERAAGADDLALPADLNEEKTIGKEIVIFKAELDDRYPLVDEIAVIDSGSTDRTREIAASFGADVYLRRGAPAAVRDAPGQGREPLEGPLPAPRRHHRLRRLRTSRTSTRDSSTGWFGPLIQNPDIHYVKAFYDRPLAFSQGLRPTGGGRVTEILIRPLFSLFYPELAAIIQPLSGEYAGRRVDPRTDPVPGRLRRRNGHADRHLRKLGLGGFAQTDLDVRVHRNQETTALGRMAFGVLRTFLARLTRDQKARVARDLPSSCGSSS